MVTESDGVLILLNIKKSEYFSLDEIGSIVLSLIQEKKDFDYILEAITNEYNVPRDQLKEDITIFCEKLAFDGILVKEKKRKFFKF